MEELTDVIVGAVVSITNALLAPSEPVAPGAGKVRVLALPAISVIVLLGEYDADTYNLLDTPPQGSPKIEFEAGIVIEPEFPIK